MASDENILDALARRAREARDDGAADEPSTAGEAERLDLVEVLRAGETPDLTLGGYIAEHDRPPAFEGEDGQPYTVGVDTEPGGHPDRPFVAFLVFVRWAATGAGVMDHVETGDVAWGRTADEAMRAALDLSLYDVKAELDAAIRRRAAELED